MYTPSTAGLHSAHVSNQKQTLLQDSSWSMQTQHAVWLSRALHLSYRVHPMPRFLHAGANAMAISLHKGQRVTLSKVDAFADGVAVKQVGAETFRLCQQLVDGIVLVDNRAISAAIKDVFNETRSILEPAGAVAVAGTKAYLNRQGLKVCSCTVHKGPRDSLMICMTLREWCELVLRAFWPGLCL